MSTTTSSSSGDIDADGDTTMADYLDPFTDKNGLVDFAKAFAKPLVDALSSLVNPNSDGNEDENESQSNLSLATNRLLEKKQLNKDVAHHFVRTNFRYKWDCDSVKDADNDNESLTSKDEQKLTRLVSEIDGTLNSAVHALDALVDHTIILLYHRLGLNNIQSQLPRTDIDVLQDNIYDTKSTYHDIHTTFAGILSQILSEPMLTQLFLKENDLVSDGIVGICGPSTFIDAYCRSFHLEASINLITNVVYHSNYRKQPNSLELSKNKELDQVVYKVANISMTEINCYNNDDYLVLNSDKSNRFVLKPKKVDTSSFPTDNDPISVKAFTFLTHLYELVDKYPDVN